MAEQLFKTCTKCYTHQPIENFPWKHKALGIRHAVCKTCTAQRSKRWYGKNKTVHKQTVKENNKSYRQEVRQFVAEYLATHPCVDCGENDPVVLEFDHRGGKVANVSMMASVGYSLEKVKAEIAKCDVRCANCHRRKTARTKPWLSKSSR